MAKIRCNARGCSRQLWIPKVGLEGEESSAMCAECKQVALCINHFSVLWRRGSGCPKCKSKKWVVHLFEGSPFSPMLQAELIAEGGRLQIIEESSPRDTQGKYHRAQASSSQVMMNVAARSQQQIQRAGLDPSAPRPQRGQGDPYQGEGLLDEVSAQDVTWVGGGSHSSASRSALDGRGAHPPPPRGWRLITREDLSSHARGLGDGIAIEREQGKRFRMMDDDLIIRHIDLDGEVISITQSPRKQRLIAECMVDDVRQMLYVRNTDVQGFITNPISDDCEVFGARFINDTSFVMFAERPDGRLDLREGRFKRARQIQTRVVGASLPGAPLAASPLNKGHFAFLFKELSGERYLPVCRRISNGEDTIIGPEVSSRPLLQATSRNSSTVAWSTQSGEMWVSRGLHHRTRPIDQRGVDLLAVSADGQEVAWSNESGFFSYHLERQRVEQWAQPQGLIALGWRG